MKKNLTIISTLFFILITACGFKPTLSETSYNFSIKIDEKSENNRINSKIKDKLEILNGKMRTFSLALESDESKKILSKDSKGDPTILEIVINLNYKLSEKNKLLVNRNLKQRSTYNNISDKFELTKSEEILIDNLVENLASDIISSASNQVTNPMTNDN